MIAAVVLAAGLSRRMGRPKMVLPWGDTTVIGKVVSALEEAEIETIAVVTGAAREALAAALPNPSVRLVINPAYENGEMLGSLQVGLASLAEPCTAALIVLGDQPQIQAGVIRAVCSAGTDHPQALVIPSYQMRRGHPWLMPRRFWEEVQAMRSPQTLRDFIQAHSHEIAYVEVQTPTILMDLDTMEEYERAVKKSGEQ